MRIIMIAYLIMCCFLAAAPALSREEVPHMAIKGFPRPEGVAPMEPTASRMITASADLTFTFTTFSHWPSEKGNLTNPFNAIPMEKIDEYGLAAGTNISYRGTGSNADLSKKICTYGPQIVKMTNRPHWLATYGKDSSLANWPVLDPERGRINQLSAVATTRIFSGPESTFTAPINSINFRFYSPLEAFVIDPQGRRYGYDPKTDTTYTEIPTASYTTLGIDADDEETFDAENPNANAENISEEDEHQGKELEIMAPVEGDYTFILTGTGVGTYDAYWRVFRPKDDYDSGITKKDIAITPGEVHAYRIHYSATGTDPIAMGGLYDGSGQNSQTTNKFLTYANPLDRQVVLPANTTSYPLMLFYSAAIVPDTFQATLNGADISDLFHPQPGNGEMVTISLKPGKNVLNLSIQGQVANKTSTDKDQLVLQVK